MTFIVRMSRTMKQEKGDAHGYVMIGAEAVGRGYNLRVACSRAIEQLVSQWKDWDLITQFEVIARVEQVAGRVGHRRRDKLRETLPDENNGACGVSS